MDFNLLKSLGLSLNDKTKTDFEFYMELFKKYNAHTNLISKNDENLLFEKHIFDSLAFNLFSQKYGYPETIMDIGTGGGFPSLPLALIYPKTKIFAIDSTSKKINFIKEVKEKLKLENIEPMAMRIEELPLNLKESFDVVTTRALGNLRLVLEYAVPYLKVGGYFVAYKSTDSENELNQAKNVVKILKTELVDSIGYKLPLDENFDRKLLIFKKESKIPPLYPRQYSVMKKTPL